MTYLRSEAVDAMIKDWQRECADHPAIHNQGNVLRDRLAELSRSTVTRRDLNSTQMLLSRMAEPLGILCPWDGDINSEEMERFEALVLALDIAQSATTSQPTESQFQQGDGE